MLAQFLGGIGLQQSPHPCLPDRASIPTCCLPILLIGRHRLTAIGGRGVGEDSDIVDIRKGNAHDIGRACYWDLEDGLFEAVRRRGDLLDGTVRTPDGIRLPPDFLVSLVSRMRIASTNTGAFVASETGVP